MKSTLYLKFIFIYIVFGFLSLFTAATLTENLVSTPIFNRVSNSMYREATMVANDYLPGYFSGGLTESDAQIILSGIETQLDAAVWFVSKDGKVILSAQSGSYPSAPDSIKDFDPAESGSDRSQTGDYHGYFNNDVITVTVPVTYGYSPKGYLMIHQYTSVVDTMTDGTIPPELHEKYLKIILFETERLTDLTQDLLTLNEFDTNHLLLNREVFDIHEMIKHVAASFEGVCTQKKISIELVFATKHLNVNADKRKIQQVLYNLLDNAIKFSDPNSIVTIETTDRGEKVYTSVKDNGMGIPRSALGKIWERFYKSDLSRGKDKKGTGLGLAIVKEAIQAHGENITVVSTEGVGTEFSFSLPKVAG